MRFQSLTLGSTGLCLFYSSKNVDRQSTHLLRGITLALEISLLKMILAHLLLPFTSIHKERLLQEDADNQRAKISMSVQSSWLLLNKLGF